MESTSPACSMPLNNSSPAHAVENHPTILHAIAEMSVLRGTAPCAHFFSAGEWTQVSWTAFWMRVRRLACGLIAHGFQPGQRAAIFSATRLEWTLADMAILHAGGITVPIYQSLTATQVGHILCDSGTKLIFAESAAQVQVVREACPEWDEQKIIVFNADGTSAIPVARLEQEGTPQEEQELDRRLNALTPEQPASYVYTSGTTGEQKGVVIRHKHILGEIHAAMQVLRLSADYTALLCLPLPHVLGRMAQFFQMACGCQTVFSRGLDRLAQDYREVRPHFVVGVPRMLEKMKERIESSISARGVLSRLLFRWAARQAQEASQRRRKHRALPSTLRFTSWLADVLVMRRLRAAVGGRLVYFISGGAPLAKCVAEFFWGMGIHVLEGYGLTETFAAVTVNRPEDVHLGTVGKPLSGVAIRIADDGEVLVKGPMVFDSYLHLQKDTEEAFDADGWFHTGDIGEFSKDGFLRITDRKKELIVTAGGKKVAPTPIERQLEISPLIDHAMVYGDQHKFLVALVTVSRELAAQSLNLPPDAEYTAIVRDQRLLPLLESEIRRVNQGLAAYETIKRFLVLPRPFSVASGELTPTLKVRRKEVAKIYRDLIESLYAG